MISPTTRAPTRGDTCRSGELITHLSSAQDHRATLQQEPADRREERLRTVRLRVPLHPASLRSDGGDHHGGVDAAQLCLHHQATHHHHGEAEEGGGGDVRLVQDPDTRAEVAYYDLEAIQEENNELKSKIEVILTLPFHLV